MTRPQTRAQLEAQFVELSITLQELQQRWEKREAELVETIDRRNKTNAELVKEIERLRDELHRLELENARLGGVIERVRELDPMSERELVSNDTATVANQLEQASMRLRYPLHVSAVDFAEKVAPHRNGASVETPAPYYRRRF